MTAVTDPTEERTTLDKDGRDDIGPGDGPPEAPADRTAEGGRDGSLGKAVVVMALVAATLTALILVVANRDTPGTADPYEVVVPTDAGRAIIDGSGDDLVPSLIRLQPGQQLVLENQDWGPHILGSLTAERGQTVRLTYPTEGRHITATTLRADGRVTILVEDTDR